MSGATPLIADIRYSKMDMSSWMKARYSLASLFALTLVIATETRAMESFVLGPHPRQFPSQVDFPGNDEVKAEGEPGDTLEWDIGDWTVAVTPSFEKVLLTEEELGEATFEISYAASVTYRLNGKWRPRLDFFAEPGDEGSMALFSPALDVRIGGGWSAGTCVSLGLTDSAEKTLVAFRVEYEF